MQYHQTHSRGREMLQRTRVILCVALCAILAACGSVGSGKSGSSGGSGGGSGGGSSGGSGGSNPGVAISPQGADVRAGSTQQFTATVTGEANNNVTWSVNAIVG
ncbi:MAG: Ig-like domain-containing protein, partial [Candidatus Acidiferrales bacterium]